MILKFNRSQYWKHEDCSDSFIHIRSAYYNNDNTVSIFASWLVQKTTGFEEVKNEITLRMSSKEYKKWHPYKPVGDYTYLHL